MDYHVGINITKLYHETTNVYIPNKKNVHNPAVSSKKILYISAVVTKGPS